MAKPPLIRDQLQNIGEEINTGSVDSILASLFHSILKDTGVNTHRFNYLMEKYLSDNRNRIPQNIKEISSARSNLRNQLLKAAMTWKVFCKGLAFLHIRKFEFSIRLHWSNHKVTEHRKMVVLGEEFDENVLTDLMSNDNLAPQEHRDDPESPT